LCVSTLYDTYLLSAMKGEAFMYFLLPSISSLLLSFNKVPFLLRGSDLRGESDNRLKEGGDLNPSNQLG